MLFRSFSVIYVSNSLIQEDLLTKIIELKNQHWVYPLSSHKMWIENNLTEKDYHLAILDENGKILAYLNIVALNVKTGNKFCEMFGVGNVCVDKMHSYSGLGLLLMNICYFYIHSSKKNGILLCKNELIKFYSKTGWKKLEGSLVVNGADYEDIVMLYDLTDLGTLEIEKSF